MPEDPKNEAGKGGMENMFKNTPVFAADLSGWNVKNLDPDLNIDFNTKAGSNKQGEWPNFGEDPTPPSVFPGDYQQGDNFIVNDGRPIRVENSIEFGDGNDELINTCMLQVGGAGLIDLGSGRDQMKTNSWVSARTLDGGDGNDVLTLTGDDVCNGGARDEDLLAQSMEIDNFERIEVAGGTWQLEGDHRKADVLISGGTMQVPLLKRSLAGLNAKRFQHQDGEITVDLSDTDLSSNNLEGRWVVLKAKGLKKAFESVDTDNNIEVLGADNYDAGFKVKGSRLLLNLSSPDII